ncbi:3-beta hydroxysteroid dehydrogenase/isomerase family-domain-containing protein [Dimargaris cristalligena]|uniref:3-beta hydroxysteroid dehydrogenase/isomerase family-domain-containing protein n=1 Tax=Dimargaris cristalligena TaxID=215637 RepID=A0A4P9ZSF5_9FUNG|nr:3-beta hydroxysteroid dehydrogenase/isomerase family-domain-containing protein [Dimargaris cristalligena]|eukprot:RKP36345.1 3-beta hydroxysteroid dehydrogenase/isomerase family-domain-containing protein [Dimargaris cristalligena]
MSDTYLVIGGCGFLGSHIVEQLLDKCPEAAVRILDLRRTFEVPRAEYFIGDICDYDLMVKACTGVTAVIHTASPHAGVPATIMRKVNVEGTANVIRACRACSVPSLIFTSSSSVVLGAQGHLTNADETTPYPTRFADYYGQTKAEAEQLVLAANDPAAGFRTCSLRPAGIFGPRDQQMVPQSLNSLKKRANLFQIGSNHTLVDCTYVGNVAHAHLLAVERLPKFEAVAGEAFFITNDNPVLFWDPMRALWSLVGASTRPVVVIPDWGAYLIYYLLYGILTALSYVIPTISTRAPFVVKLMVTHRFFNITKAKTYLGYRAIVPLDDGFRRSVEWYRETQKS